MVAALTRNGRRKLKQLLASSIPKKQDFSSSTTLTTRKPLNLYSVINQTLHIDLETDPWSYVFGEDCGYGGVFRCTTGLANRFGKSRVFNTPLCEQGIIGFRIGLATMIVNEATKFRYRSGN